MKFFLNSKTRAYLRSLESEFGESSNAIRVELNRLEKAGMLQSNLVGNKKMFQANIKHPLFKEVHNIVLKHIGLDRVVENVIERLGQVSRVFVVGDFAKGLDSQVIDLVFIGDIDQKYLIQLIDKVEDLIKRRIRYLIYTDEEFEQMETQEFPADHLLLWSKD
ncbi:MAG: ArsR family transcriptional regulator [Saprospiraceae bacterium]|nr:ArsR family transcriptional regulator [Saprospiraceae bacterium]